MGQEKAIISFWNPLICFQKQTDSCQSIGKPGIQIGVCQSAFWICYRLVANQDFSALCIWSQTRWYNLHTLMELAKDESARFSGVPVVILYRIIWSFLLIAIYVQQAVNFVLFCTAGCHCVLFCIEGFIEYRIFCSFWCLRVGLLIKHFEGILIKTISSAPIWVFFADKIGVGHVFLVYILCYLT